MATFRKNLMLLALAAIALLTVLSICSAFLGAEAAGQLFTSPPLAAFWAAVAATLAAGLLAGRGRLVRSPGLLAMHLGCLVVIVGAMWGSRAAHHLRAHLSGRHRIHRGVLTIDRGRRESAVREPKSQRFLGWLPFEVKLESFRVDYHDRWLIYGGVVDESAGPAGPIWMTERIDWTAGRWARVPGTDVRMRVLEYLPAATRRGPARLEIRTAGGRTYWMPMTVGAEAALPDPPATVKVLRVFRNIRLLTEQDQLVGVEHPGPGRNPAAEVRVELPDRTSQSSYVLPGSGFRADAGGGLEVWYRMPRPELDAGSAVPAAKVQCALDDRTVTEWLMPADNPRRGQLRLMALFADAEQWARAGKPSLFIEPQPRQFESRLAIVEAGRVVARKTVRVNQPAYHGGYAFYHSGYDQREHRFTILTVASTAALPAVYAGLVLLCAGAVWHFWAAPPWRRRKGPR